MYSIVISINLREKKSTLQGIYCQHNVIFLRENKQSITINELQQCFLCKKDKEYNILSIGGTHTHC